MELDDQLAALAAGELDDTTARALRARAASDPALAQRLARHEELERLLQQWTTPPMDAAAASRLHERIDEELAALGDDPLVAATPSTAAAPAALATSDDDVTDAVAVTDLAAAREARTAERERRHWTSWAPGVAVAAALVAVVGTGIVLGGLPAATDLDLLAGGADDAGDDAEAAFDDQGSDGEEAAIAESAPAEDSAADMADESAEDDGAAALAPSSRGVDVAEGDLLVLVEAARSTATTDAQGDDAEGDDGDDGDAADRRVEECVVTALERDSAQAEDRVVAHVATGTYAGREAVFVVIRTPAEGSEERFEVLAYDPAACELLARDETTR